MRYASADDVILALDKDPNSAPSHLVSRAESEAEAATEKWVNRTGRPFHPVRVGDANEPRTWEVYDVQHAASWYPATVFLDNAHPLPLDAAEGDTLEIRDGRNSWTDVTDEYGDAYTLDNRRRRLRIYQRRLGITPYDDPNTRFCRLTYRYGPLGDDVQVTNDGLVETVPADVRQAVVARAAMELALDDDARTSIPDDGQLTSRTSKRSGFKETWEDTAAEYSGFSSA